MEAKDTVLSYLKVSNQIPMTLLEFIAKLEEQAEISFKAGVEHGMVISKKNYLLGRAHGRREVVEWIRTQQLPKEYQAEEYKGLVVIANKFWQAKLKEWGVKE